MRTQKTLVFILTLLFSCIVLVRFSNAQTLDVITTINSNDPGYPTNPINICLFTSTITTTVTNPTSSAVSGFLLEQSLPGNVTIVSPAIINGCSVPFQQNGNVVTYDFTSISISGNGGFCTITADFIIPCNASPDVNLFYTITNTIPTSGFSINSNDPSFQITKPKMVFVTHTNGFLEVVDEANNLRI